MDLFAGEMSADCIDDSEAIPVMPCEDSSFLEFWKIEVNFFIHKVIGVVPVNIYDVKRITGNFFCSICAFLLDELNERIAIKFFMSFSFCILKICCEIIS